MKSDDQTDSISSGLIQLFMNLDETNKSSQ